MRVHVVKDNRLFPGRLDLQIMPVDQDLEPEWAANKITHHISTGESAIFQVLWTSGNKLWVPYAQIRDLNLLKPYLEALGIENLTDLPHGSGAPPRDPQIYAGYLKLSEEIKPAHSPLLSNNPIHQVLNSITIPIITMPYHSPFTNNRLLLLSNIHLAEGRDKYLLYSSDRKEPYTLEAIQLDLYIAFDRLVCRHPKFKGPAPFAYGRFADLWNDSGHPCGFSLMNKNRIWEPEGLPVPHELFAAAIYHDPHLEPLRKAELIKEDSSVDEALLASWKTTAKLCIER